MSCVAQKMKPSASSDWTATFPNEIQTETQSNVFVKKLIALTVSSITYLRAIFPESAFGNRSIEDLRLKILSENSGCHGASQLIGWIKGSFDALEKKYLRQLMIGIYESPDEPDNVIESYTFRFIYENDSTMITCNDEKLASVSNNSIVLTKKATFSLLRTVILLMQNLKPLPETAYLTMKLLYYDEVTPEDYEPPGFKPADSPYFYFKSDPINIKVGDVLTPFHSLKLRIKTDKKQFEFEEEPKDPSPTNKKQFNCEIMDSNENLIENILIQDSYDDFKEDKKNEPMQLRSSRKNENESCKSKSSKLDEVQCPCGLTKEDPLMLSCVLCNKRQHAICFGILDESQIPKEHLCENCRSLNSDRPPTDAYLSRLNPIELQALCLWRQALVIASKSTTINCTFLIRQLHVDTCVANSILSRLEDEKYVQAGKGKDRKKKVVNKKHLTTEGFLKYMNQTKKHSEEFLNDNPNEKSDECGDLDKKIGGLSMNDSQRGQKRIIYSDKEATRLEMCSSQEGNSDADRSKRQKVSKTPREIVI